MRLSVAVLVLAACGERALPEGPPLGEAANVTIVAHQDDDLIFMQPDITDVVEDRTGLISVYVTAGEGTATGDAAWSNETLMYRGLSAPLAVGPTVVFGDVEGYVHWLSRDKGEVQLRLPTDGSPIVAAPALSGTTMLIVTKNGGLYAFRPE